ncbi:MAG: hypothetical protein PHC39_04800 [Proteiniphilum sp.]|nr:hypothetical protein [Proteiniphilum sp.]
MAPQNVSVVTEVAHSGTTIPDWFNIARVVTEQGKEKKKYLIRPRGGRNVEIN